ncbi:unnamed protein product [Ambrosiozyma monospora]|uniref:Unnamed protein product n=1 Tax=Ambrosiozyma monospora TaxID=43982 RepID=A0A9W6WE37_AMBMO|nr:unnamed protein product [Ambrosiozyma monospora]
MAQRRFLNVPDLRTKFRPSPPMARKYNIRSISTSSSDSLDTDTDMTVDSEKENSDPNKYYGTSGIGYRKDPQRSDIGDRFLPDGSRAQLVPPPTSSSSGSSPTKRLIKGRKVSKLTLLYEQEIMKQ